MKYIVSAFPRKPLTQEIVAEDGDVAIDLALSNPNGWSIPTPSNAAADWNYYAVPVEDPAMSAEQCPVRDPELGQCVFGEGHTVNYHLWEGKPEDYTEALRAFGLGEEHQ
jgi:hypothetical protein